MKTKIAREEMKIGSSRRRKSRQKKNLHTNPNKEGGGEEETNGKQKLNFKNTKIEIPKTKSKIHNQIPYLSNPYENLSPNQNSNRNQDPK